jgi:hypothetical protein
MAAVTLKIKLDIPGLQQELDSAVNEIRARLGRLGIFKFDVDSKQAEATISELEKHVASLKALLQEKIEMNADTSSISLIQDRITVAEDALRALKGEASKPVKIPPVPPDPSVSEREQALKQLQATILQVALAENTQKTVILELVKANNLSEKEIKNLINIFSQEKSTLAINSQAYRENVAAIEGLTVAQEKLQLEQRNSMPVARQVSSATGAMTNAMGQFGFLLGDMDMMFVNFRVGLMSIANNVGMVAQTLVFVQNEVKRTGESFKTALVNSLMGSGGVLVAINALMFLLQVLPRLFEDSTKAVEEHSQKIDELANKYQNLTRRQLENRKNEVQTELAKFTEEMGKKYGQPVRDFEEWEEWRKRGNTMDEEETARYQKLLDENRALDEAGKKVGYIKDLQNTINQLIEKRDAAQTKGGAQAFDKQIQYYQKLLHEMDLSTKNSTKTESQYAKDLAQARVDAMKEGKDKELAQLDAWLKTEQAKYKSSEEWQTALKNAYNEKRTGILNKYAEEEKKKVTAALDNQREALRKQELLYAEEIQDEYDKDTTKIEINNWYDKQAIYSKINQLKQKKELNEAEKIELATLYTQLSTLHQKYLNDIREQDEKKLKKVQEDADKEMEYFKSLNQKTLSLKQLSLDEELKLIDKQKELELQLHGKTEEQKRRITEYYDLLRQQKIDAQMERETRANERFFNNVYDMFERAFDHKNEISDAEVEMNEYQFQRELADLKKSLDDKEIDQKEYRLRVRLAEEDHNNYLKRVEENRMDNGKKLAQEAQKFLLNLLKEYLIKYVAQKAAEATIHSATEAEKTAATEAGVLARIALLGMEIIKTLAAAAAKVLTAIADGISYLFATLGPFALVAIPAMVAGTIGIWNGIKNMLGFRKGGYTGDGPTDEEAGLVHKREFVFESGLVDQEPEKFQLLHRMLRSGLSLTDIFMAAAQNLNPITEAPVALSGINLSTISVTPAGGLQDSRMMTSLLSSMDSRLKNLEEKGFTGKVEVTGETEIRGKQLYIVFKEQEKVENRRMASNV